MTGGMGSEVGSVRESVIGRVGAAYMRPIVDRRKKQGRIYATPTISYPSIRITKSGFFNIPPLRGSGFLVSSVGKDFQ